MIPAWMIDEEEQRIWDEMHKQSEVLYEQLQLPLYYDEPPVERPEKPKPPNGLIILEF